MPGYTHVNIPVFFGDHVPLGNIHFIREETNMHVARGKELKVGDRVMVPMTVISLGNGEDYCNVGLQSMATMPPSHTSRFELHAVNTKQVFRANLHDEFGDFKVELDGEACRLR